MMEENANVSRSGDLELEEFKIDQKNHADMDTSEAGPSFGGELGSPKLKENAEIGPAEAEPSRSRSKLKKPEEIGSTSEDFNEPVSSDTDNFSEEFQPKTHKIELYQEVARGNMGLFGSDLYKRILRSPLTPQKNSALHVAAQYKQAGMAEAIIDHVPKLVNCRNMNGDLPLHIAARVGCVNTSGWLIPQTQTELNVEINYQGDTPLHDAVRGAHLEVVKLLVQKKPHWTSTQNEVGESPLFVAVDKWRFDIAKEIFSKDECSIRGRDSMNVLHAAIIRLGQDCVDFVKEVSSRHPTAVSEADKFGFTPFHYAAHYGRLDICVHFLLKGGDSIAYKREKLEGMSAVHIAARNGCVQIIDKLINKFPDSWELLNNKGMTALHVAVESGKQNVVDYLLENPGFEGFINKKDKDGNTPLHLASIQGDHGILVKLAEDERVDGSAINNNGFTAVDIVQSSSKFTNSEKAYISFRLKNRFGLLTLKEEVRQMKESEDKPVKETDKAPKEETELKNRFGLLTLKEEVRQMKESEDKPVKEIHKAPKEETDSQSNGNGMYKDDMYVVVATLIASVTFGAALQTPGGYKSDDPGKGSAIMIKHLMFNIFVLADCFSFALSSASIFVHFWASIEKSSTVAKKFRRDARILTNLSIGGMVVAFTAGIHVALGPSPTLWAASSGLCIFFLWGPMLIFNRIATMICKKAKDKWHLARVKYPAA